MMIELTLNQSEQLCRALREQMRTRPSLEIASEIGLTAHIAEELCSDLGDKTSDPDEAGRWHLLAGRWALLEEAAELQRRSLERETSAEG